MPKKEEEATLAPAANPAKVSWEPSTRQFTLKGSGIFSMGEKGPDRLCDLGELLLRNRIGFSMTQDFLTATFTLNTQKDVDSFLKLCPVPSASDTSGPFHGPSRP